MPRLGGLRALAVLIAASAAASATSVTSGGGAPKPLLTWKKVEHWDESMSNTLPTCKKAVTAGEPDCYPQADISQAHCLARGCCWKEENMLVDGLPACFYPLHYGMGAEVRARITRLFTALGALLALCSCFVLRGTLCGVCTALCPVKLVRAESLGYGQQMASRGGAGSGAAASSAYQVVPAAAAQYSVSSGLSYQDAVAGAQAPEDTGSVI